VSKIHIVTDSAAVLDPTAVKRFGITVMPLKIRIDGKIYEDGTDISPETLLLRMTRDHIRPQVIGPTTDDFRKAYRTLTRDTDQIISLHSSASLSPIVPQATRAADEFLGRCDISVIDSETTSLGLGILVEEAARLAQANLPLNEIVRQIRGMIRHIYVVFVTATLDYLEHSHLISPAQAVLGSMLNIKPFLLVEEGEIVPQEKVRTPDRAIDKLAEFAGEFSRIERLAILQSASYANDETRLLTDRLEAIVPGREIPILVYGPVLATQIGPDGLGLMVYDGPGRSWTG